MGIYYTQTIACKDCGERASYDTQAPPKCIRDLNGITPRIVCGACGGNDISIRNSCFTSFDMRNNESDGDYVQGDSDKTLIILRNSPRLSHTILIDKDLFKDDKNEIILELTHDVEEFKKYKDNKNILFKKMSSEYLGDTSGRDIFKSEVEGYEDKTVIFDYWSYSSRDKPNLLLISNTKNEEISSTKE